MKIKVLAILRSADLSADIGDIITIEDTKANKLILAGAVEEIKEEVAEETAEETAEAVVELKAEVTIETEEEAPQKVTSKKKR